MSTDRLVQSFRASLVKSQVPTTERVKAERAFVASIRKNTPPTTAYREALKGSVLSAGEVTELLEEFMPTVEQKELGL